MPDKEMTRDAHDTKYLPDGVWFVSGSTQKLFTLFLTFMNQELQK